jgi:hypothetical protein
LLAGVIQRLDDFTRPFAACPVSQHDLHSHPLMIAGATILRESIRIFRRASALSTSFCICVDKRQSRRLAL